MNLHRCSFALPGLNRLASFSFTLVFIAFNIMFFSERITAKETLEKPLTLALQLQLVNIEEIALLQVKPLKKALPGGQSQVYSVNLKILIRVKILFFSYQESMFVYIISPKQRLKEQLKRNLAPHRQLVALSYQVIQLM